MHTLGSNVRSCCSLTDKTGGQTSASTHPLMSLLNEAFESTGLPLLKATQRSLDFGRFVHTSVCRSPSIVTFLSRARRLSINVPDKKIDAASAHSQVLLLQRNSTLD